MTVASTNDLNVLKLRSVSRLTACTVGVWKGFKSAWKALGKSFTASTFVWIVPKDVLCKCYTAPIADELLIERISFATMNKDEVLTVDTCPLRLIDRTPKDLF